MQVEAYLLRLSKCLSPKNDSKQYNWNQVRKSDAYGVPAVFCITPLMVQSLRLYHFHCPNEFIQTSSGRNTYYVIKQSSHSNIYTFFVV